jgi:hypothetical protein
MILFYDFFSINNFNLLKKTQKLNNLKQHIEDLTQKFNLAFDILEKMRIENQILTEPVIYN